MAYFEEIELRGYDGKDPEIDWYVVFYPKRCRGEALDFRLGTRVEMDEFKHEFEGFLDAIGDID